MSSRDKHVEVMRYLETMSGKIEGLSKLTRENNEELRRIRPQKNIEPILRPKQGTQIATKYIRQFISEKNADKGANDQRYEEFSDDVNDKQYNTDAMSCLEWILGLHLAADLGVKTWEQVFKSSPGKMGLIIRDATSAPELKVFAQAAGQWAIQMLITNKMNSRIRFNRCRKDQEFSLAPMVVPDLEMHTASLPPTHVVQGSSQIYVNGEDAPYAGIETAVDRSGPEIFTSYEAANVGRNGQIHCLPATAQNRVNKVVRHGIQNANIVSQGQFAMAEAQKRIIGRLRGSETKNRGGSYYSFGSFDESSHHW